MSEAHICEVHTEIANDANRLDASLDESYLALECLSEEMVDDMLWAIINVAMARMNLLNFKYAFADLVKRLLDDRVTFRSRVRDAVEDSITTS